MKAIKNEKEIFGRPVEMGRETRAQREIGRKIAEDSNRDKPATCSTAEEVWRRYDGMEARLTAPLSERMLDLAGIEAGMRVLDLSTGRGDPAICAAHRVRRSGSVLGVDLSERMLQMARERATCEGISNLDLRTMNVELLDGLPNGYFHASLMRWGLMYLD